MNWLIIGLGGSLGAVSRYLIGKALKPYSSGFPYPTLVVNILGSFLFGLFIKSGINNDTHSLYIFITGGFLGAFTTFSTFSFESISILNEKQFIKAGTYIFIHLIIGIGAAFLGYYLL